MNSLTFSTNSLGGERNKHRVFIVATHGQPSTIKRQTTWNVQSVTTGYLWCIVTGFLCCVQLSAISVLAGVAMDVGGRTPTAGSRSVAVRFMIRRPGGIESLVGWRYGYEKYMTNVDKIILVGALSLPGFPFLMYVPEDKYLFLLGYVFGNVVAVSVVAEKHSWTVT